MTVHRDAPTLLTTTVLPEEWKVTYADHLLALQLQPILV
jgi:hypothetical protein